MQLEEVLKALEDCGTEQNRKVYARHGVRPPLYGVSYAELGRLQKKIRKDQALATELWATGNHDARVLATMVCDPDQLDRSTLDDWSANLDNYVLADALGRAAARSPDGLAWASGWLGSDAEWRGQVAWNIVAALAAPGSGVDDEFFAGLLEQIEREIHSRPNRMRHAMYMALIAIGGRSARLEEVATAAAQRIGKVYVDHGRTGCKTPDAIPYIRKIRARAR
ncbi:MAG: DNA alkylation repair protein [Acidobacteriota bacterium]